jgi:acetaldehyde dehydrogenase
MMRDTVFCAIGGDADEAKIVESIVDMVREVAGFVPGYQLAAEPQFDELPDGGTRVGVLLEVEGAGDFLPAYAGNLDIMTAAAVRVGEELARALVGGPA